MYDGAAEVYEGYTKSLWSVFGPLPGAIGGISAMVLIYVMPPLVMLSSRDRVARRWGALGYTSGVIGRVLTSRAMGERVLPDALAQPISIGAFAGMTSASLLRRRRGALSWKGRSLGG
jgi:spore maturation protein SpmB